ncbi:MliC family protein [Acerihabitans sp. TG2]|uniref:MliC family protein n=1 Tax=Acerihabitans sp. TG2 TaxID=3096008 RepID=UPI002B237E73|nr:MliC family protein [Acerihabitans sp. TG2]MEA9391116.1 MliC family protein [Acerihabitans sp. TG2]
MLTACGQFGRQPPSVKTLHYQCGTLPLTVRQSLQPPQVSFILDGQQLTLHQQVSASGVRYSDGHYTFWSKGNNAFIEREGKIIINDCIIAG